MSADAPRPAGPYSHAVSANGLLFTASASACRTRPPDRFRTGPPSRPARCSAMSVPPSPRQGSPFEHVLKTTVHLQDLDRDFAAQATRRTASSSPPPRTRPARPSARPGEHPRRDRRGRRGPAGAGVSGAEPRLGVEKGFPSPLRRSHRIRGRRPWPRDRRPPHPVHRAQPRRPRTQRAHGRLGRGAGAVAATAREDHHVDADGTRSWPLVRDRAHRSDPPAGRRGGSVASPGSNWPTNSPALTRFGSSSLSGGDTRFCVWADSPATVDLLEAAP